MNRSAASFLAAICALAVGVVAVLLVACSQQEPAASPTVAPPVSESPVATATEEPLDQDLLARRVTVLVLGRDMNETRRERGEEHNTDSIIVASVNADHDEISMLSIPRDTVDVPLEDGETFPGKVNAISRELGHDEMVGAVEALLEIEIDYYVQVDMDDLERLVDAVDGVDVVTETAISDPGIDFFLDPGEHHLDGADALSYTRSRQDGDHARSARQQEVLLEVVTRLVDPETDIDVRDLVEGLESLETDIPLDKVRTFVEIARLSEDAETTMGVLSPPDFATFEGETPDRGWVMIPNIDAMRAYAAEVMGD